MPTVRWPTLLLTALLLAPFLPGIPLADTVYAEPSDTPATDVDLYLYMDNGQGMLTTNPDGGLGDDQAPQIADGSTLSFALDQSLRADLTAKEYRSGVGFHIYLYVNTNDWQTGHLDIAVYDASSPSPSGGTLLAQGDTNVAAGNYLAPGGNDEVRVDLIWEDNPDDDYLFREGRFLVVELENTGTNGNAINVGIDATDTPAHLITKTNPISDITIVTEAYELATAALDDRIEVCKDGTPRAPCEQKGFEPNLPAEWARAFISGTATNAFGGYDIAAIDIEVSECHSNPCLTATADLDDPSEDTGMRAFNGVTWSYNEGGDQQHDGAASYSVTAAVEDLQGHHFSLAVAIQLDTYGVFISTEEREKNVAVGGSVTYDLEVRNSGANTDDIEVRAPDPASGWDISPRRVYLNATAADTSGIATFTVTAPDSITAENSLSDLSFKAYAGGSKSFTFLTTTTIVAEFNPDLYFTEEGNTEHLDTLSVEAVAGQENNFTLQVANLGQTDDSIELSVASLPADWELTFAYQGDNFSFITVADLNMSEAVSVDVWVNPATALGDDIVDLTLIGKSLGNETKTDAVTLTVERTFGLVLRVVPDPEKTSFPDLEPGKGKTVNLVLESKLAGEHTVVLQTIYTDDKGNDDDAPAGWSTKFTKDGSTITNLILDGPGTETLKLVVTPGTAASYTAGGYTIFARAQDRDEPSIFGRRGLNFNLRLDTTFQLSVLRHRVDLEPGASFTFELDLDNQGNTEGLFILKASAVPKGWRVTWPDGSSYTVPADESQPVKVAVTVGDDARDGDEERIRITATLSREGGGAEEQEVYLTVTVEQDFSQRLSSAVKDMWYLLLFAGLAVIVGLGAWYRSVEYDDEWDETEEEPEVSPPPTAKRSNDWDEWD